jgi:hypothetical protein
VEHFTRYNETRMGPHCSMTGPRTAERRWNISSVIMRHGWGHIAAWLDHGQQSGGGTFHPL